MSQEIKVVVSQSPDYAAGLRGFTEVVTVSFDGGDWDLDEIREDVVRFFGELLDGRAIPFEEYEREMKRMAEAEGAQP